MSDPTNETVNQPETIATQPVTPHAPTEAEQKSVLMQRAKLMGLKVSPNIGLETLRQRINAALDSGKPGDPEPEEPDEEDEEDERPVAAKSKSKTAAVETENQKRSRLLKEAMKLVRVRITCLNPNKKDLPGEIFTIGNRYIGTVRKFVPFGEATDNGYHIPHCIYEHLKTRKFLQIQTRKSGPGGDNILVKTGEVNEFAIEVLPQLTRAELHALAQRQAMAAGTASPE